MESHSDHNHHHHNSHHHHNHHEMMNSETTTTQMASFNHEHNHHHPSHHNHHEGHNMMSMDMSMHMTKGFTLHTSSHFLFEGLRIDTVQGVAIAIIITVILTVLFEGCNSFVVTHMAVKNTRSSKKIQIFKHVLLTLLKTFSTCVGYVVMLAVMSYNIWILIAVILGSGISYLFIRPIIYQHLKRHQEDTNSEHEEREKIHDFPSEDCISTPIANGKEAEVKLIGQNSLHSGDELT